MGAAFFGLLGLYRAFSEGLVDAQRLSARLAKRLFEGGDEVMGSLRQTVAEVYLNLFCEPFRLYGNAALPDEAGEDDVQENNDGREERRELALSDGTHVLVREIRPEDAPALQRLVGRLSEQTIHLRFFGPMNKLSEEKARHFAEVDGEDRYALVALDPEDEDEIVAVVRYDREADTDRAEYAALVEDRLQGRGLGLALTHALIEAARKRGVRDFEALVLPENRSMIRLLGSLDLPERLRWENGVKHFSIDLFPERASQEDR